MKQGLMIQSLQPIISPHKNEVPRGAELLFGLQKEGWQWECVDLIVKAFAFTLHQLHYAQT